MTVRYHENFYIVVDDTTTEMKHTNTNTFTYKQKNYHNWIFDYKNTMTSNKSYSVRFRISSTQLSSGLVAAAIYYIGDVSIVPQSKLWRRLNVICFRFGFLFANIHTSVKSREQNHKTDRGFTDRSWERTCPKLSGQSERALILNTLVYRTEMNTSMTTSEVATLPPSSSSSSSTSSSSVSMASSTLNCTCENQSESVRVECLVRQFQTLMVQRRQPLNSQRLNTLLATPRLADIELFNVVVDSATHEFAENQILYTFIKNYVRSHPQFLVDGPDIGVFKLKTSFFQSTWSQAKLNDPTSHPQIRS